MLINPSIPNRGELLALTPPSALPLETMHTSERLIVAL